MSPQEFAEAVRRKYPTGVSADGRSYADINDTELTNRWIKANPEYKDTVKMPEIDLQGAVNQAMSSQAGPEGAREMPANQTPIPVKNNSSFLDDFGQDLKEGLQDLQNIAPERSQKSAERLRMVANPKTFGQGGFGVVAQGVGALLDTAETFVKTVAKVSMSPEKEANLKRNLAETAAKVPGLQTGIELLVNAYESIKASDPDLARSLEDAGILTETLALGSKPVRQSIELGVDGATQTGQFVAETAPKIVDWTATNVPAAAQSVYSKVPSMQSVTPNTSGISEQW